MLYSTSRTYTGSKEVLDIRSKCRKKCQIAGQTGSHALAGRREDVCNVFGEFDINKILKGE